MNEGETKMWNWQAEGQAHGTIVLVHSAYENHTRYRWQIEEWRQAGFHVFMRDLAGHGNSRANKKPHFVDFSVYESEIDELVRTAMKEDLPVFLVAHGFGAMLAISYLSAAKPPIAGAIFTSPWLQLLKTPSMAAGALSSLHKLTGSLKVDHGLTIHDLTRNVEAVEQAQGDETYKPVVTIKWYRELQNYMKQIAAGKVRFPNIPLYVHTGGKDVVADKEAAKIWLKNQSLNEFGYKEWKHAFHDLFQEPEREDVWIASHFFIKNILRSLGYAVK